MNEREQTALIFLKKQIKDLEGKLTVAERIKSKEIEHRVQAERELQEKFNVQIADVSASFSGQFDSLQRQIRDEPELSWGKSDGLLEESDKKDGGY